MKKITVTTEIELEDEIMPKTSISKEVLEGKGAEHNTKSKSNAINLKKTLTFIRNFMDITNYFES